MNSSGSLVGEGVSGREVHVAGLGLVQLRLCPHDRSSLTSHLVAKGEKRC